MAERQARDAAGAQTDLLRAAKRQAVLRQVHAQREALALLSRNAPVPAQLLRDVGPPTADFDPEVVHSGWAHQIRDASCQSGMLRLEPCQDMLSSHFSPGRRFMRMRRVPRTTQHLVSTPQRRVQIASTARCSMVPSPR